MYLLHINYYSIQSNISIGLQSKTSHILSKVENLIALPLLVLSIDKFAGVIENSLAGTNIRGVVTNTSYTVLYDQTFCKISF